MSPGNNHRSSPRTATLAQRTLRFVVRGYQQFLSPLFAPACRFTPSCSQYALDAINEHGALKGLAMTLRRLARCHPWSAGGYDAVPSACSPGQDVTTQDAPTDENAPRHP